MGKIKQISDSLKQFANEVLPEVEGLSDKMDRIKQKYGEQTVKRLFEKFSEENLGAAREIAKQEGLNKEQYTEVKEVFTEYQSRLARDTMEEINGHLQSAYYQVQYAKNAGKDPSAMRPHLNEAEKHMQFIEKEELNEAMRKLEVLNAIWGEDSNIYSYEYETDRIDDMKDKIDNVEKEIEEVNQEIINLQ